MILSANTGNDNPAPIIEVANKPINLFIYIPPYKKINNTFVLITKSLTTYFNKSNCILKFFVEILII